MRNKWPFIKGHFLCQFLLAVIKNTRRNKITIIDPSSPIGKIRLRIGDWQPLPILPDIVIQSALADCDGNVPRAAALSAQYVLATLTTKTHRKLANLEVWSNEQFSNYVAFIKLTILNPHNMSIAPVPYSGSPTTHPLTEFVADWNASFGSAEKNLHYVADVERAKTASINYNYTGY